MNSEQITVNRDPAGRHLGNHGFQPVGVLASSLKQTTAVSPGVCEAGRAGKNRDKTSRQETFAISFKLVT